MSLDPNDPIDLAAMLEADAMVPNAPPLVPPEAMMERFELLQEAKEKREAARRQRMADRKTLLNIRLGPGWFMLPLGGYSSRDGETKVSDADMLYAEGMGHWPP